MLIKFFTILLMVIGLVATFVPRLPGTAIILTGVGIYGMATDFVTFSRWTTLSLVLLVLLAEVGGRILRVSLTRHYPLSRSFGVNSAAGSLAGIVSMGIVLGPLLGMAVWELISGKTLMPHWKRVQALLLRMLAVASFRFCCGLIMFLLVIMFIMQ